MKLAFNNQGIPPIDDTEYTAKKTPYCSSIERTIRWQWSKNDDFAKFVIVYAVRHVFQQAQRAVVHCNEQLFNFQGIKGYLQCK